MRIMMGYPSTAPGEMKALISGQRRADRAGAGGGRSAVATLHLPQQALITVQIDAGARSFISRARNAVWTGGSVSETNG
jgi:hypothetical protein